MNADDRLAIHELEARYGFAIDDEDWAAFDDIFTANAVVDFTNAGIPLIEGLAAIKEQYSTQLSHPVAHVISGFVIREQSSDHAIVRCKLVAPRDDLRVLTCDYDDLVVCTEAGWRIQRKTAGSRLYRDALASKGADG